MKSKAAALSLVLLAATSCGGEEAMPETPGENEYVAAFRAGARLQFEECGDYRSVVCSPDDCGSTCSDAQIAAARCVEAAFESCRPAHFRELAERADGGWETNDVFVLPEGEACHVVKFRALGSNAVTCAERFDCNWVYFREETFWCELFATACGAPTNLEGNVESCPW